MSHSIGLPDGSYWHVTGESFWRNNRIVMAVGFTLRLTADGMHSLTTHTGQHWRCYPGGDIENVPWGKP